MRSTTHFGEHEMQVGQQVIGWFAPSDWVHLAAHARARGRCVSHIDHIREKKNAARPTLFPDAYIHQQHIKTESIVRPNCGLAVLRGFARD